MDWCAAALEGHLATTATMFAPAPEVEANPVHYGDPAQAVQVQGKCSAMQPGESSAMVSVRASVMEPSKGSAMKPAKGSARQPAKGSAIVSVKASVMEPS